MKSLLSHLLILSAGFSVAFPVSAQDAPRVGLPNATQPSADAPQQIIVERQSLSLIDPDKFQVPMEIMPADFITVLAPRNGVIAGLRVKPGAKLNAKSELFRLENQQEQLAVKKAEAQVALAKVKAEQAKKKNDPSATAIADAELTVANVDLEIAKLLLEQSIGRTERAGVVYRVFVVERDAVNANQPILEIGDPATMVVEIPMNRADAKEGSTVKLKVEDQEISGTIKTILPLADRFEPLRSLFESVASVVIEIDNRSQTLQAGQAVYAPMIPREIVAEVPNAAISTLGEGERKIQVIRNNIVRDLPIVVLAGVGSDRSYVSGTMQQGDELILKSSVELADGTQLAPEFVPDSTADAPGRPGRPARGADPKRKPGGF